MSKTRQERIREREYAAFERGVILGINWVMQSAGLTPEEIAEKSGYTVDEVRDMLGYGSYSAAASALCRLRVPGVYRDDETGRWRLDVSGWLKW